MIQKLGHEAWLAANPTAGGDTITMANALSAVASTLESLTTGMFRGRWDKATPAEKALLAAIAYAADDTGIARTADITCVLGRTAQQISSVRRSLIDKGLVAATGHGMVRLTMPGFGEFVLRHADIPASTSDSRPVLRQRGEPRQ